MAYPTHHHVENGIYFVTSKTHKNKNVFSDKNNADLFIKIFIKTQLFLKFKIFAYVLLPDHFHILIQPTTFTLPKIMNQLKGSSARYINISKNSGGRLWQEKYFDYVIRNNHMFKQKFNYIHNNPIKHNITSDLSNYPYSSFQHYLNKHGEGFFY